MTDERYHKFRAFWARARRQHMKQRRLEKIEKAKDKTFMRGKQWTPEQLARIQANTMA